LWLSVANVDLFFAILIRPLLVTAGSQFNKAQRLVGRRAHDLYCHTFISRLNQAAANLDVSKFIPADYIQYHCIRLSNQQFLSLLDFLEHFSKVVLPLKHAQQEDYHTLYTEGFCFHALSPRIDDNSKYYYKRKLGIECLMLVYNNVIFAFLPAFLFIPHFFPFDKPTYSTVTVAVCVCVLIYIIIMVRRIKHGCVSIHRTVTSFFAASKTTTAVQFH
jgi:hypothetical protein